MSPSEEFPPFCNRLFPFSICQKSRQLGSALLLTLLVVSLLLVVVVTFSILVRMELRQVIQRQDLLQARANARLGAELAIAQVQTLAGPDTRITLPAEADSSIAALPQNRFWTGVRDAAAFTSSSAGPLWNDQYTSHLGWLVSGQNPDPSQPVFTPEGHPVDGHVLLLGPASVSHQEDQVAAEAIPLLDSSLQPNGTVAWWSGEENTKTQINLSDPFTAASVAARTTIQRNGTEQLLPTLDRDNEQHLRDVHRLQSHAQVDLAVFQQDPDAVPARELFHAMTMGSYGLPVNTRSGGLKRDLTPVFQEAWDNNGSPPSGSDTQYSALIEDQESRINQLRAQTLAMPSSRPSHVPLHAWNALRAGILRADQADTSRPASSAGQAFQDLIFPPFSDMVLVHDSIPSWRQLISFSTMNAPGRGLLSGDAFRIGRHTQHEVEPHPVIARMNMGIYFSFDHGVMRSHFVPSVVLWNPWSRPLAPRQLYVRMNYSNQELESFKMFFHVSHPDWDGGRPRWTGAYSIDWAAPPGGHHNDRQFIFELEPIELPAGAAMVFTLDQHHRFEMAASSTSYPWTTVPNSNANSEDSTGFLSSRPIVPMKAGLQDGGGYSMYLEEDLHSKIQTYATITPIRGDYNDWRSPTFPMYNSNPALSDVPEAQRNMAINEGGLEGWRFHETRISWSRSDYGSSAGMVEISLGLNPDHAPRNRSTSTQPLFNLHRPYRSMPSGFHSRGVGEGGWDQLPRFSQGLPPSFPGDSQPFTFDVSTFPSFPTWGLSWGVRLPRSVFQPSPGSNANLNIFAPLQWVAHSNPTASFHTPLPNSLSRGGGNQRQFETSPSYIGGFTLDGASFFDLSQYTDDDDERYMFIGHRDDLPPRGFHSGEIPRVILREAPRSIDELVSPASLQHAPLMGLNVLRREGNYYEQGSFPASHPSYWNNGGNLHPTYAIGNSLLQPFADPAQPYTNLFAITDSPPSPPSPPWRSSYNDRFPGWKASPWYDLSWTLNHVLWDDYLFSSSYNSRILWKHDTEDRDYLLSASRLKIEGAFNVNSTSVEAWAALLSGLIDVEVPNDLSQGERSDLEQIPFARFLHPHHRALSPISGEGYDDFPNYSGTRRLTMEEVTRLAEAIVEQVRERGPFLSMSDFVNRRLLPPEEDAQGHRLEGALQAAIRNAGLNDTQLSHTDPASHILDSNAALNHVTYASYDAGAASGATNRSAPGYLMQADLLSRIGAVLQTRSDTFTIRAFGEGPSGAKAWCEVVIQRNAEYVDDTDPPDALPGSLSSPANERFGRTFSIIRFRWLGADEV